MSGRTTILLLAIIANSLVNVLSAGPPIEFRCVEVTESRADNNKYRLPNDTVPEAYDISLGTRVDLVDFDFHGLVRIDIRVVETTRKITLHARRLSIKNSIRLSNQTTDIKLLPFQYDVVTEFLTIPTTIDLIKGNKYSLEIEYTGELRNDNHGFYRSSYINKEGSQTYLATTQFESTDARHAFPCYDEPSLKANFTIHIMHGASYSAISNMRETRTANPDRTVTTHFETTPLTSTYLIAFVVSDFKFKTNKNGSDTFVHRTYASPLEVANAEFALHEGEKILNAIAKYLKVSFTLPKMDQIAIPQFDAGAMENWGLVTYRKEYFLYNKSESTFDTQINIVTIIAHEFGHQWFGNLVSPKWWSYLWLNEGFANLFEHIGTDLVHQDWHVFDYYVVRTLQRVMKSDELKSTRPMTYYVESPEAIDKLFDVIAYGKSGSVLRMFLHAFTENSFKKGLNYYLNEKAFKSADEDDLFLALERAVKEDKTLDRDLKVQEIFKSWSNQKGFPLLTVTRNYKNGTITLSQQKYFNRLENNETTTSTWWIPYNFAWSNHIRQDITTPDGWLPQNKVSKEISPSEQMKWTSKDWVLFNIQQTGFYRVLYDEQNYNMIIQHLSSGGISDFHPINRAQLLDDAYSFMKNKLIPYTLYFNLMKYLSKENSYVPWVPASNALFELDQMLLTSKQNAAFKKFTVNLVNNTYRSVGVDDKPNETPFEKSFRRIITTTACHFGVVQCLNDTFKRFNDFIKQNSVSQNIRATILNYGIRSANAQEVKSLWEIFTRSHNSDVRLEILRSLGNIKDEQLLWSYLNRTIVENENIRFFPNERRALFKSVAASGTFGQSICINLLVKNLEVAKKLFVDIDELVFDLASRVVSHDVHGQFNILLGLVKKNAYIKDSTAGNSEALIAKNFKWLSEHQKHIETYILNHDKPNSGTSIATQSIMLVVSMVIAAILCNF